MSKKISAVIVDDEKRSRNNLKLLLEQYCPEIEIGGVADGVETGLELIKKQKPAVVFLDIEMPERNGFSLIEELPPALKATTKIVFTTAYEQYALRAFKVSAVDYLLKPIDIDELQQAIKKINEAKNQHTEEQFSVLQENYTGTIQKIAIPHQYGFDFLKLEDIICLEAKRNYTDIFRQHAKNLLVAKSLGEFEELLLPSGFFRPHRSYLINLRHVEAWVKKDGGHILLSNQLQVPLVKSRRDDFFRFYQYLG